MTIRAYHPQDHKACISIFKSNCPKYFDASEQDGFEYWLAGVDTGKLAYKNTSAEYFFVLERDGKTMACGGFYLIRDTRKANMVWGMADKAQHGKGYGKSLFSYRIDKIKELNICTAVKLDTTQHIFGFFEKFGFEVIKITPDAYGAGLNRYDMVLSLS